MSALYDARSKAISQLPTHNQTLCVRRLVQSLRAFGEDLDPVFGDAERVFELRR